jgi:hypothetical protein
MARPERYFIGPTARAKLQEVFAAHDGTPSGTGGPGSPTRLQGYERKPKRSRYFRTTEEMPACGSAFGTEVRITSPDCIQVEDVEDAEPMELFDVSNSVRVFNLVKQRGIDLALPVGSIVEAISESQTSSDDLFWRVLQVLSCDCGSGSSSSGSSTSGSSTSGSSGSGSGCQNIQVVTGVSCVNGSIQVTKTTICAVVQ